MAGIFVLSVLFLPVASVSFWKVFLNLQIKSMLHSLSPNLLCLAFLLLFLKNNSLYEEGNDFSVLQRLKFTLYGGSPLKREVVDCLYSNKITTCSIYGSSELGIVMSANLSLNSRNGSSLRPYLKDFNGSCYIGFETVDDSEPDIKHAYVRGDYPMFGLGIANRPDGGYSTNNLFRESSIYPGFYDYIGRLDDVLIMKNGEKTNLVPMEATMRQSNIVH